MSLKTLIEKARFYCEVFAEWQLARGQTKDGVDNELLYKRWVSVDDLKTFLDDYVLVPRKQLSDIVESFPIDMMQVGKEKDDNVEVYSLGTKRQIVDYYRKVNKLKELLEAQK